MTFYLPELPEPTDLPKLDQPLPSRAERAAAALTAERIRTDSWQRSHRYASDLLDEITAQLGEAAPQVAPRNTRGRPMQASAAFAWRKAQALKAIQAARARDPELYMDLPYSDELFTREVRRRLKADYKEANAVLGAGPAGGWLPELAGQLGAGATDEMTLLSLPLGAPGRIGLGATMAVDAIGGAFGELATSDRQIAMADQLGIDRPNMAKQALTAGLLSGGLSGVLSGAARFAHYRRAKGLAANEMRLPSASTLEHEQKIRQAQSDMEQGQPMPPATAPDAGAPLRFNDFDFSAQGNASPQTNRIGYVFGRLLENGFEPHIAAGLTGNLMQEGGVGLNTGAVGDGGNAFGMAQWNGLRRKQYLEFARTKGKPKEDLDTQIDFLIHEWNTTERAAAAKIKAAKTAREAAIIASKEFWRPGIPHLSNRVKYAALVYDQYQGGSVPRWTGPIEASDYSPYRTSRGYTGEGQVRAGDDTLINVEYQVVDLSLLRQASGDLQPRDRARAASDAWVSDTAARLDPALLMPSPSADRGAPIVGPDNIIESGNGRVRAISRAYEQGTDRITAYRQQIEAAGFTVPDDVRQPVLIARRTSALDDAARKRMVIEAQDSGVARMTATERAQVGQHALDAELLARHRPAAKLSAPENRDFARGFAGAFPRSERNAFIGDDGAISIDGIRQMQDSLFARAWDAPDILRRGVEAEPGEMKTLLDALASAAPEIARLRAEIAAGLVRPEMDITPFILDAVRLIAEARQAAAQGGMVAQIMADLMADADLFGDAVSPLTQALVRFFAPNGRQMPAAKIADFLRRYADEARKAGKTGDALLDDLPGPLDILKRLEPKAFADIAQTGAARIPEVAPPTVDIAAMPADAYRAGAAAPEAIAADDLAEAQLREAIAPPRDPMRDVLDDFAAQHGALEFELPDGTRATAAEYLSDLDHDAALDDVLNVCAGGMA